MTTTIDPEAPQPSDLVRCGIFAKAPDRRWVSDVTYVPPLSGSLHLAMVMDAHSR